MGESLGRGLLTIEAPHRHLSVLASGVAYGVPVTVHVAIGTDVIHEHPSASGSAIGATSFHDFEMYVSAVTELGGGGVLLNFGCAVLLPEVFLKAVALSRNLEHDLKGMVTADFDMIRHYRPMQNVVRRPEVVGGRGFSFLGHHEIVIPLLVAAIGDRLGLDLTQEGESGGSSA